MEEPKDLTPEQTKELDRREEFARILKEARGELFPLKPASPLGGKLFLSVRCGETGHPEKPVYPDKYMIVDLFEKREDEITPIGHYDWEVWTGRRAHGNLNKHGFLDSPTQAHRLASRKWLSNGFDVDRSTYRSLDVLVDGLGIAKKYIKQESDWNKPVYQKRGYGSLLVAVSALALKELSVTEMNVGTLSSVAQKAWARFGQGPKRTASTQEVIDHSMSKKIIKEFI